MDYTLFAGAALLIGLAFALHWLALPIVTALHRNLPRKWLWVLAVLIMPLSYVAVVQIGRLTPLSWRQALARFVLAGVTAYGIICLSNSPWVNTKEMFELKGNIAQIFSENVGHTEGATIWTAGGSVIEQNRKVGIAPFAYWVAASAVIAGAMQFYAPVIKSLFLTVLFFCLAFLTELVTHSLLVAAFADNRPIEEQALIHDFRLLFNFHLWYLTMFAVAILWVRSDIRLKQSLPEEEVISEQHARP